MKELPKSFEPNLYEQDIYSRWEESGLFNPDVCVRQGVASEQSPHFSIVLPPPNVTGTLHMGHASMLAIEDVLVRYHRMKGDRTLWVPGTDHAAVATESKVENILIKEEGYKKPKEELGREAFLARVEQFAQESHDTIVNQCRKMGASLDWSREAYTLDETRSRAVRTVFKKMYDDGLIYRGYRVINWSVKGQSTCSDDELVHVERPGTIYYFKYSKDFPITIATTRPETKLGDTAVAVHPDDERYKQYIGQVFTVDVGAMNPLQIHIIADEQVDSSFGTGALGVTPAHSMVDFDMYAREKAKGNDIGLIQVIGEDGRMTMQAGRYAGLPVLDARKNFVDYLRSEGLLEKEEETVQNVGTSDRFGDVVEPLPKTQWFVDVNKKFVLAHSDIASIASGQEVSLKELMQAVVREKHIDIIPDRFEKTYFHWIDNLRDWCISRQIWFGHRIPVWYRQDETYVGVDAPEGDGWVQDSDTLDTWFSSGLWTFTALGWPDNQNTVSRFHPTSVLETGYDILFFWVARMILMTTYTLGAVPFKTVYLHGLVRDEKGRKMSKSLGNIINPLDMIAKYGTDATRLSLLVGNTPGNDMKLSEEKIAGFRNFSNKLWNMSRFMLLTIDTPRIGCPMPQPRTLADRWILNKLSALIEHVTHDLDTYAISMAGERMREFTWSELADWYLEIAKIEGEKSEVLNYILNTLLALWHPFMPFVTETIWQEIYGKDQMLMVERWPAKHMHVPTTGFEHVMDIVTAIRSLRAEYGIEPGKKIALSMVAKDKDKEVLIKENQAIIKGLARAESIEYLSDMQRKGAVAGTVVAGVEAYIDMSQAIDAEKEILRLSKEIDTVAPYVSALEKKLSNEQFVQGAPAAVVAGEKKKLQEAKEKLEKLTEQLRNFSSV